MRICQVAGAAVATARDNRLEGYRLLLCQPLAVGPDGSTSPAGPPLLALDTVGAAQGNLVAMVEGSAALAALAAPPPPTDAVVVAIIDKLQT